MTTESISFPDWENKLMAKLMPEADKAEFAREIIAFLRHCKTHRAAATTDTARSYLGARESQGPGRAREALRWFYMEGRRSMPVPAVPLPPAAPVERAPSQLSPAGGGGRALHPPPAASDMGASPWEQDLIKAMRERGFLWRTEQTYRGWAKRFAEFVAPRSPEGASGEEVAAFLSALAVQGRASPSAQKQAA